MVPVCDKRYHIYNRFRHFGAEIKKLWNYPFTACQKDETKHVTTDIALQFDRNCTPNKINDIVLRNKHSVKALL